MDAVVVLKDAKNVEKRKAIPELPDGTAGTCRHGISLCPLCQRH